MFTLLHRARRRLFCNELLSQGANTGSAALLVFIVLLLLGTEILNWHWLVLLPVGAAAGGVYIARRRLASLYGVAQMIDGRMGLYDALSTAIYFRDRGPSSGPGYKIRTLQAEHAERLAQTVDLRRAAPYSMPRTVYAMAALALVASSLFALRFGLTRTLDLKAPLATILQQRLGYSERNQVARKNRPDRPPDPANPDGGDASATEDRNGDEPEADPILSEDVQPVNIDSKGNKADAKKQGDQGQNPEEAQAEAMDDGSDGDGDSEPNSEPGYQGSSGKSDKDSGGQPEPGEGNDNAGLLNKLKDAMQNLISKVKAPNQSGQQSAQDPNGKQGKTQQASKQQNSKDGQQSGGESDGQEGESSEQAESSQDSSGKNSSKNDSQQNTKQPGSGVGSQDGDKSLKQAEQLAAMGKISEIIGKRSASISGETTVEVQSTRQTLATPYSQRGAQHTQGGAEISRDEVPVALQSYVQQYFEYVRKPAPAISRK